MSLLKKKRANNGNLKKRLGARIKKLRLDRGLTQENLAEAMDSNASYIGAIEIGQKFPRAENLSKIAESLGVPVHQLFMFEGEIPEKQRTIRELMDYLKNRSEIDAKFLLAVSREHTKAYGEKKNNGLSNRRGQN